MVKTWVQDPILQKTPVIVTWVFWSVNLDDVNKISHQQVDIIVAPDRIFLHRQDENISFDEKQFFN